MGMCWSVELQYARAKNPRPNQFIYPRTFMAVYSAPVIVTYAFVEVCVFAIAVTTTLIWTVACRGQVLVQYQY